MQSILLYSLTILVLASYISVVITQSIDGATDTYIQTTFVDTFSPSSMWQSNSTIKYNDEHSSTSEIQWDKATLASLYGSCFILLMGGAVFVYRDTCSNSSLSSYIHNTTNNDSGDSNYGDSYENDLDKMAAGSVYHVKNVNSTKTDLNDSYDSVDDQIISTTTANNRYHPISEYLNQRDTSV